MDFVRRDTSGDRGFKESGGVEATEIWVEGGGGFDGEGVGTGVMSGAMSALRTFGLGLGRAGRDTVVAAVCVLSALRVFSLEGFGGTGTCLVSSVDRQMDIIYAPMTCSSCTMPSMLSSESSTYSFDFAFSAFFDFDRLHVFVTLLLLAVTFFVACARDAFGGGWTSPTSMLELEVGEGGFNRFGGLSALDSSLPGNTTCILRFSRMSFLG